MWNMIFLHMVLLCIWLYFIVGCLPAFLKILNEVKIPHWVVAGFANYYWCQSSMVLQLKRSLNQGHIQTCHCPTAAVRADHVLFSHVCVINLPELCACYDVHVCFIVNLRNSTVAGSCCCLLMHLKVLIFRGNALVYIKGPYIFLLAYFFTTALRSLSRPPTPRYIFHVLKNSIAPSPIVQARHLDRLEPYTRSQWIKEWRSLRGGDTFKRSRCSTPPSPTLDTPADFAYFSSAAPVISNSMMNELTLNVIAENSKEEAQTCLWEMNLFSTCGIIYYL